MEVQFLADEGKGKRATGNVCTPGTNLELDGKLVTKHIIESSAPTFPPEEWVKVEVEVWPTSMVYEKGTRIRLDVQPHDGQHYFSAYHLKNNTIYTGGDRASYVLLPVIPAQSDAVRKAREVAHGQELDTRK